LRRVVPEGRAPAGGDDDARGRDAERPGEIPGRGWRDILRRIWRALGRDHAWVTSAAVAYCFLFAAIPGGAVSLVALGLIADPAGAERRLEATRGLLPPGAVEFLAGQARALAEAGTLRLGAGLGGALLAALWGARAGAGTLIGALNIAYRERETRPFLRYQAAAAAVTAGACLFGLLALALVIAPPAAAAALPLGPGGLEAVSLARWPALALLTVAALAALYRYAPSRSRPKWRWVGAGAVAATALWLAGSAALSHYVARFGSSGEALGVLGAMLLLMTWFYLTAFAVLLGAELNAEMERQTGRDTTDGPALPAGERGARVADASGPDG
jgi:membrane protein